MTIPKLRFRKMSLQENIELIKWAYYENDELFNIHNFTIKYFPELENLDKNLSKEEIYQIIERVVKETYKKHQGKIEKEIKRYNTIWEPYNNIYFQTLSNYLNINWPKGKNVIEGRVGLIPIFPRYLDSFSFSVSVNMNDQQLIETCAHETLHFLWFEKWKTIHPETPRAEFESPYMVWQYSEMVTDPILNNKPFSDIFDFQEKGYDNFYKMYDGETLVMDNLRKIYSKNITIEEKIEMGFDYITKALKQKNKSK